MIPTATPITEVDNLPGQEVAFSIGNPLWVMKNLAKLYSDTAMAVIREYSTNAVDSHIMAGKADVPIEISLPDLYNPYFVVQDYGLGMSEEDLTDTYTKFGNSTKRETNDVNGMYGFGSKSAVAYTNQFTIQAVKDGVEVHAIVSKRPDYSMTLKVVSKRPTDAENGVKITIPVGNHAEFRRKANDFYRFWQPGTVLVDGVQPTQAVGEKIDEGLYFSPNQGTSYVVMGNVGYRITNSEALFKNARMNNISFVAYVDGGAVEHTPSREDLEYTDHTKATLHNVIRGFEEKLLKEARKQIETAATPQEAWDQWNEWGKRIGGNLFAGMEYKGIKLVHSFATPNTKRYKMPYGGYNTRYNLDVVPTADVREAKNILFVTDHLTSEHGHVMVATDNKRKAREYVAYKQMTNIKYVYFMAGEVDSPWIPKENIIAWDDLKAALPKIVKPRVPRAQRPKGLFDFYTVKGSRYAEEIPEDADLFYITASDARIYEVVDALQAMKADEEIVVVHLAINRVDKFKRDNFGAREFTAWAKAKVETNGEKLLDDRSKMAMSLGAQTISWVTRLDENKIDDPEWKLVKELIQYRKFTDAYERNLSLARSLGMRYDVKEYRLHGEDDTLTDKYPLLEMLRWPYNASQNQKDQVITYLNAVYAAKKGKP